MKRGNQSGGAVRDLSRWLRVQSTKQQSKKKAITNEMFFRVDSDDAEADDDDNDADDP